jgi:hydroxymethylbilane synthase
LVVAFDNKNDTGTADVMILDFMLRFITLPLLLPLLATSYTIRIGTRPSPLACVQAEAVAKVLTKADSSLRVEIVELLTAGDSKGGIQKIQDVPLALRAIDFTGALDAALKNALIDLAVHSLKDIPPTDRWQEGLFISCPLPREDPADVLVGPYPSLSSIPRGSTIGTSSIRRQAQLLSILGKDGVEVRNVRGNLHARLQTLEDGTVDALILAHSGLKRLSLSASIPYYRIPPEEMLPGACQGIVGAVCLDQNDKLKRLLLKQMNHDATIAASAERSFLDCLDSSSPWVGRPPLAGLMQRCSGLKGDGGWVFRGLLARPDGKQVLRASEILSEDCSIEDAVEVGARIGSELLLKAGSNFYD